MSEHVYTLTIKIEGKHGDDSELDDVIGPDGATREDLLLKQWEELIKADCYIDQGFNHLLLVSLEEEKE